MKLPEKYKSMEAFLLLCESMPCLSKRMNMVLFQTIQASVGANSTAFNVHLLNCKAAIANQKGTEPEEKELAYQWLKWVEEYAGKHPAFNWNTLLMVLTVEYGKNK